MRDRTANVSRGGYPVPEVTRRAVHSNGESGCVVRQRADFIARLNLLERLEALCNSMVSVSALRRTAGQDTAVRPTAPSESPRISGSGASTLSRATRILVWISGQPNDSRHCVFRR
ncbi:hypothetical protein EMIT0111MI5_130192 [Burkholderia sp. IT-111MI5]